MITINSTEINLNHCINSKVRARAIDGTRKDVTILQHEGNVVTFLDSRGNHYQLPENIKLNLLTPAFDSQESLSPGFVSVSLKKLWQDYGSEEFFVESFQGDKLGIKIQGINHVKYGWTQENFSFQEGNLIIDNENLIINEDIAPSLAAPITWTEIDEELIRHENGQKSYGKEELRELGSKPIEISLGTDILPDGKNSPLSENVAINQVQENPIEEPKIKDFS